MLDKTMTATTLCILILSAVAAGCDGDDGKETGGTGGAPTTGGGGTGATQVTGGGAGGTPTGSGGTGGAPTGGAGGAPTGGAGGTGGSVFLEVPTMEVEKVGNPVFELVDFHQRTFYMAGSKSKYWAELEKELPPPGHEFHSNLGIGPGQPHAGPYDHEISDGYAANGWIMKGTYTVAESQAPNAILSSFMVIPTADAPTGKSPDSDAGPIIPNTIFPIHYEDASYLNGELIPGNGGSFDVPPLDENLDPPFEVDGHSHFPMFHRRDTIGEPKVTGLHEWRGSMIDVDGNGWNFTIKYAVAD